MKRPTAEFSRRVRRFFKAYVNFIGTGNTGDLFPSLYSLIVYCIYSSPDKIVKNS